ncbi:shikimate kinase [Crocosphaera sp. UHCC 0190]|uniref:shikimate kinase n=1 Tax=Crocosphaera sp. UHCC 0190 TaxID=3110246 RepID=UPI002B207E48|nr:shikimate kinase [Crocosphaera sp. UHCC 0190]MEA5510894.1 shikimate kinase [Crocosphaera sp. UHCC 0190]
MPMISFKDYDHSRDERLFAPNDDLSAQVMQRIITTGTLIIASIMGLTILSHKVQASPSCYGIDEAGNTLDLSQICSPSPGGNSLPSVPNNSQAIPTTKPENNQAPEGQKDPKTAAREESDKDLQACFNSPACREIMEGEKPQEKTPHQVRIDQVLNGGVMRR